MNRIVRVWSLAAPLGAFTAMASGSAHATPSVTVEFESPLDLSESSFTLNPSGGVADTQLGAGYIDFPITDFMETYDAGSPGSYGPTSADLLVLGSDTSDSNIYITTGTAGGAWNSYYYADTADMGQAKYDTLSTPAYDGSAAGSFTLQDGRYGVYDKANSEYGPVLAVGVPLSAAPEPEAWSLLILGAAGIGAAARRRRSHALAAA